MNQFIILLFAIAAGLTASGLLANTYRLMAGEPKTKLDTVVYCAVMVVAGPVILAGKSTRSFRQKECSKTAYGLALALTAYWSFAIGLLVLSLVVAFRAV